MAKQMGRFQQTLVSLLLLLGGCTMFLASRDTEREANPQRIYSNQVSPTQSPAAITPEYDILGSNGVLPESGGKSDYCGYCTGVRQEGGYVIAEMEDGREVYVWGWEGSWWGGSDIRFKDVKIGPDGRLYATSVSHCE
jgi:hypothetical protein